MWGGLPRALARQMPRSSSRFPGLVAGRYSATGSGPAGHDRLHRCRAAAHGAAAYGTCHAREECLSAGADETSDKAQSSQLKGTFYVTGPASLIT
jgi:hypothetical protein